MIMNVCSRLKLCLQSATIRKYISQRFLIIIHDCATNFNNRIRKTTINLESCSVRFRLLDRIELFLQPWTAALDSLSITKSANLLKLMSMKVSDAPPTICPRCHLHYTARNVKHQVFAVESVLAQVVIDSLTVIKLMIFRAISKLGDWILQSKTLGVITPHSLNYCYQLYFVYLHIII